MFLTSLSNKGFKMKKNTNFKKKKKKATTPEVSSHICMDSTSQPGSPIQDEGFNFDSTYVGNRIISIPDSYGPPEIEHGSWKSQWEPVFTIMGFMIGLGNVWSFPKKALVHGGGTFVMIYIIVVCLAGFPLVLMELALAQYKSLGPLKLVEDLSPYFKGLGYGMVIVAGLVPVYYNTTGSWFIFYMMASFQSKLPWTDCGETPSAMEHCSMSAKIIGNITDRNWSPSQYYYFVDFRGYDPGNINNYVTIIYKL